MYNKKYNTLQYSSSTIEIRNNQATTVSGQQQEERNEVYTFLLRIYI